MSSKALAKQRQRYWEADPHCYYCGVETILKPSHIKGLLTSDERDRLATIDHIRPRHHPDRTKPPEDGEKLHVLACWRCNNDRDRRELLAKPKEWFEERGGTPPLHKRSVDELESILAQIGPVQWWIRGRRKREAMNKKKRCQIDVLWALWEKGMD